MTPRKLNVFFANFAYAGNGGYSSEHPDIRAWFTQTILWCKNDPRVGEIVTETLSDTPITMTRNLAVLKAREAKCDVLVFCDSDQSPVLHAGEKDFQPFFPSSFEFLYKHYDKGPVAIGCPYCGPPPGENVYVFHWDNTGNYGEEETANSLEQYSRFEASKTRGIQECAALPTGLIMYDMRCFELTEPHQMHKGEVIDAVLEGKLDREAALRALSDGWFYYEWKNGYAAEKASTEDVTQTRDLSLIGQTVLGYNPLFCNWDSPIGHWKPWCVPGRPQILGTEGIAANYKRAVDRNSRSDLKMVELRSDLVPTHRHNGNGHAAKPLVVWAGSCPQHLNFLESLAREVAEELGRAPKAVEIGSWLGASARAMVRGGATVLCVDTWKGAGSDCLGEMAKKFDVFTQFLHNTADERDSGKINSWQGPSLAAAASPEFAAEIFDIIFIDAEHTREAATADIRAWLRHLSPGGVMVIHDYLSATFPGVTTAVQEIFGSAAKSAALVGADGGFAVVCAKDISHLLQQEEACAR